MQTSAKTAILSSASTILGLAKPVPAHGPEPPKQMTEPADDRWSDFELPDWFIILGALMILPFYPMVLLLYWMFCHSVKERRDEIKKKRERRAETTHVA